MLLNFSSLHLTYIADAYEYNFHVGFSLSPLFCCIVYSDYEVLLFCADDENYFCTWATTSFSEQLFKQKLSMKSFVISMHEKLFLMVAENY